MLRIKCTDEVDSGWDCYVLSKWEGRSLRHWQGKQGPQQQADMEKESPACRKQHVQRPRGRVRLHVSKGTKNGPYGRSIFRVTSLPG